MYNINVLVPIATGFEELEAISIIDILRRAKIGVRISSIEERQVTGANGIKICCDSSFTDEVVEDYDGIVLPGGTEGANRLYAYTPLVTALMTFAAENKLIGAICASPALVLAGLGLLDYKKATCYPYFKSHLKNFVDQAVVVDSNIVTSQGPATAMEFSFKLVEILSDAQVANEIKGAMLYQSK